jgi:hypothetical protein
MEFITTRGREGAPKSDFDVKAFVAGGRCLITPDQIPPEYQKQVILAVIETGDRGCLELSLGRFDVLDEEIAARLNEKGFADLFIRRADKFHGFDIGEFALSLIERGQAENLFKYFRIFCSHHGEKILARLVARGLGEKIVHLKFNYEGFDHSVFADELMNENQFVFLTLIVSKLRNLNRNIALRLIDNHYLSFVQHLDSFTGLDKEIAMRLIVAGKAWNVFKKIESFAGVDNEVLLELARRGCGWWIYHKIENYSGITRENVIEKMIEGGDCERICKVRGFEELDHARIAEKLIATGNGELLLKNFGIFKGLDQKNIAIKLIESGAGNLILLYPDCFSEIDAEILQKMIDAGLGKGVAYQYYRFVKIDPNLREKLLKAGVREMKLRP